MPYRAIVVEEGTPPSPRIRTLGSWRAHLLARLRHQIASTGAELVETLLVRGGEIRDEARAVETLLDSRCEALVLLGPNAPAARLSALARQLPVVAVGRPVSADGVDVVRAADDEGVAQAVEHLAGLGHRRIAHVDGGRGPIATARRRGYERAMRRRGLG